MSDSNDLIKRIEETRKIMYETYDRRPNDPQLLDISQKLDILLNEYVLVLGSLNK
ncbi:hypothetical protein CIL05_20055 [Virgibacillus profundi]|uniref:Spo0E family sporulation regulatory protein-aspartic acid phosphatase n=1 Tax=Virgibacillus profundi TaxID=2024555 RepID=A0A2A2I980_9BACI|nr:aspartyl-phosphate phosphatase Spo0E family protein [Virgibacillus profundi]PAV27844.1 hypothetical protein CIL05_20055 [Virgibacillus profundi]PXY51971.1 aspartyl-phosphate phosphatase Spo0E family protein [Virgibacillus profundi]